MESLKPVIDKLEKLFSKFNDRFYGGELQTPVITVSPDTTKGAYGWCTSWKAWKEADSEDKDAGYYEINICAEHLTRKRQKKHPHRVHANIFALAVVLSSGQQRLYVFNVWIVKCRWKKGNKSPPSIRKEKS